MVEVCRLLEGWIFCGRQPLASGAATNQPAGDLIVSGFERRQNGNANGVYAIRGDTGPNGSGQLEVTHYRFRLEV